MSKLSVSVGCAAPAPGVDESVGGVVGQHQKRAYLAAGQYERVEHSLRKVVLEILVRLCGEPAQRGGVVEIRLQPLDDGVERFADGRGGRYGRGGEGCRGRRWRGGCRPAAVREVSRAIGHGARGSGNVRDQRGSKPADRALGEPPEALWRATTPFTSYIFGVYTASNRYSFGKCG